MKKFLAAAIMLIFFSIVCFCTPASAADGDPGVYLAQQSQAAEAEEDDEYEDDEEYEDDVVEINDPLYRKNLDMYWLNDGLYVMLFKPARLFCMMTPRFCRATRRCRKPTSVSIKLFIIDPISLAVQRIDSVVLTLGRAVSIMLY